MNKYKEQKEDEKIGRIISSAKMKAPENLKYRIMHQIEYESVLSGDKNINKKSVNRENGSVLRDLGSIFSDSLLRSTGHKMTPILTSLETHIQPLHGVSQRTERNEIHSCLRIR